MLQTVGYTCRYSTVRVHNQEIILGIVLLLDPLFFQLVHDSLHNLFEEIRHLTQSPVPALMLDDAPSILTNVLHDPPLQLGGGVEMAQHQQIQPVRLANRRSQNLELQFKNTATLMQQSPNSISVGTYSIHLLQK